MARIKMTVLIALCAALFISKAASAQTMPDSSEEEAVIMITQIYKQVSSDGSAAVNWEKIKSFFLEDAIIILRTSRDGSTQFTVEEFIQDFKDFYASPAVGESGFKEDVLRINAQVYGQAASIAVVYEASILNSDRPPQKGIDFWLLTRKDKTWKVVSVANDIIPPGEAIPDMFE